MKTNSQPRSNSEEEALLTAESIIHEFCKLQYEARVERERLRKRGYDPNLLAREEAVTSGKSEIIYLLVRPLLLNHLFKYLYFKFKVGDYEYLSQIDSSIIESNLWLLFNRSIKKYQPKFISRGKSVKFTTYLLGAVKKDYLKCLKNENITNYASLQEIDLASVTLEGAIESDGDNDDILNLWAIIKKLLPPRTYFILFHRLVEESTLESIADTLGISSERVRQIEIRAINILRIYLKDTVIKMGVKVS